MSAMAEPGFAFLRKPECIALRRCKPSACAAYIYIRSVLAVDETKPFACGSRDFAECGLGRDAAAAALRQLEREGLIICIGRGSFRRGKKAVYKIVFTRAACANRAGKPANLKTDTAGKPANSGRKTRQHKQKTAGFSDTLKDTSSTSSQKSEEEEVSRNRDISLTANNGEYGSREPDDEGPDAEAKREADRKQWRVLDLEIDKIAKPLHMTTIEFINAFGGDHDRCQDRRKAAYLLCQTYLRGEITKPQLMAHQADGSAGLARNDYRPTLSSVNDPGCCLRARDR